MSAEDTPNRREVAHRLFAAEFDDADFSYSESDEERAPNYVVTPTGARVNRLFAVGVLTEVEPVSDEVLRGRVVDPTGAFVTYAGQYQPDAMAFLDRTTPPEFVALSGKARTFQPEDSDVVYTSVRPESVNAVDADTRDRWTVAAAEATLERVGLLSAALDTDLRGDALADALADAGVRESLATGVPLAIDHYGTTRGYLEAVRRLAVDALEVVADEREEVRRLTADPADAGDDALGPIPDRFRVELDAASAAAAESATEAATADSTDVADDEPASETTADAEAEADPASSADTPAADDEPAAAPSADDAGASDDSTPEQSGGLDDFDAGDDDGLGEFESESDSLDDFDSADATGDTDIEGADADTEGTDAGETGDDGLFELDKEARQEVEEQFSTEFESGSEVDAPGEAGIDVPDADELDAELRDAAADETADEAARVETESETGDEAEAADESADSEATAEAGSEAGSEAESEADVDVESAAVDVMADLDDGDGAEREAVVAAVVDEHGVDPEAVEDAIESALMGGRCYEPTEDRLKAI